MAAVTFDFVRKMMLEAANEFVINPFATLLCKHGDVARVRKIEQLIKLPSANTLSPVSVVEFSNKNANLGLTNTQIARGTEVYICGCRHSGCGQSQLGREKAFHSGGRGCGSFHHKRMDRAINVYVYLSILDSK
jgi:hypothetical protein